MNDIVVNKIQSMQRCIARAREEYEFASGDLAPDVTHQDAAVLNIVRAFELAIDLANRLIKVRKLGIPIDSRQTFELLAEAGLIGPELMRRLRSMVASGTSRCATIENSTPVSSIGSSTWALRIS